MQKNVQSHEINNVKALLKMTDQLVQIGKFLQGNNYRSFSLIRRTLN